jgi:hypothetical protein
MTIMRRRICINANTDGDRVGLEEFDPTLVNQYAIGLHRVYHVPRLEVLSLHTNQFLKSAKTQHQWLSTMPNQ